MNLFSKSNKQTVQLAENVMKDIMHPKVEYSPETKELARYLDAGVRLDKILETTGQSVTWYKGQYISTQLHTTLDVNTINNSDGIIISSDRYGVGYWRYTFVSDIKDKTPEPKEDVSINLNIYIKPKVSVDHIEVNFKVEEPDLKYVCIHYFRCAGMFSVYESDSMGLKQREIGGAMNRLDADKIVSNHFPEYEVIETGGEGIKHMLTLQRKQKKVEPADINIGNTDLKNVVILYPKDGKSDVYLCDSNWKFTGRYDICTTNFSDYLHSKFPDYDYSYFENNEWGVKYVLKRYVKPNWNFTPLDLKFVCLENKGYGFVSAYESDSTGSEDRYLYTSLTFDTAEKSVVDEFPEYEIVVKSICSDTKYMLTLRRKAKKETDWRIGSYYFKHAATSVNPYTLCYDKLYELWSFSSGCNCSARSWDRQFNNFTNNFCNGSGYDTKCIDDIIYYKPKR